MTRAHVLLIAFISLLATACGETLGDAYSVYAPEHTEANVALVQRAADAWCTVTDGLRCPRVVDNADNAISILPDAEFDSVEGTGWDMSRVDGLYFTRGHGSEGWDDIYVRDSLPEQRKLNTILHELGHHWGCIDQYAETPTAQAWVMHWRSANSDNHFDSADVECAVW